MFSLAVFIIILGKRNKFLWFCYTRIKLQGGRTYIVIGKNDSYRNRQKSEFIVIVIAVVYRNNDTFGYRKKIF